MTDKERAIFLAYLGVFEERLAGIEEALRIIAEVVKAAQESADARNEVH